MTEVPISIPSWTHVTRVWPATGCLLVLIGGCVDALPGSRGTAADKTLNWPSRRGSGSFGASGDFVYYAYSRESPGLEVWQWKGDTIDKVHDIGIGQYISSAAMHSSDAWILEGRADGKGEFCVGDLTSGEVRHRWTDPRDVVILLAQPSRNGKHVAAWYYTSSEWPKPDHHAGFGLLSPDGTSFDWKATIHKDRLYSPLAHIRQVVPSDDGAYIGVAGWENGILMVDAVNHKVLWNIKPEWEAACNDLAFAPDSTVIYAGGTTGLVYAMNTKTGEIGSRWWATLTGQEEYGHRVTRVAVSPDGKFVAAGTVPNGLVFLFRAKDGRRYTLSHRRSVRVELLSFSPDSKLLASYAVSEMHIWNMPEDDEDDAPPARQ